MFNKNNANEEQSAKAQDKEFIGIKEASEIVGLKVKTLYKKAHQRLIPHYKVSKYLLFEKQELIDWVLQHRIDPEE